MISICIPIYNFDISELVRDLQEQLLASNYPYEILLIDDASDNYFRKKNKSLAQNNIFYIQLNENIGRAKIRNRLVELAKYPYLIFMDCDSKIPSENFINNYLEICEPMIICYGGCSYEIKRPNSDKYLRWKYGVNRESCIAEIRNKNPNYSFRTNNFLIHKDIFNHIKFNEELKGYGHEDTFFGLELKVKGFTIKHIDNPLIHIGLEENYIFLKKTKNAVLNLLHVNELLKKQYPNYINHSKLIQTYNILNRIGLKKVIATIYRKTEPIMKRNLLGKKPSIFIFDIYKLGLLCNLSSC